MCYSAGRANARRSSAFLTSHSQEPDLMSNLNAVLFRFKPRSPLPSWLHAD